MIRALAGAVLLAAAAALPARATPERRVRLPRLWLSVDVPSSWRVRGEGGGFVLPRGLGNERPGVSLAFEAGSSADQEARLAGLLNPGKMILRARGATDFRSGLVERRGPWAYGETSETGRDGVARKELVAVLTAPGGWYLLMAGSTAAEYPHLRPRLLRLLDGVRADPPAFKLAPYADPGGAFSVDAPTAPWTAGVSLGGTDFVGVKGPGDQPPAMMSAAFVSYGRRYPDVQAYVREETEAVPGRHSGPVTVQRTRTGEWTRFETDALFTDHSPEQSAEPLRFWTAHAVLPRRGGFFLLTYQAPPASYRLWRAGFERFVASFRPR